jgi:hypothetical protein
MARGGAAAHKRRRYPARGPRGRYSRVSRRRPSAAHPGALDDTEALVNVVQDLARDPVERKWPCPEQPILLECADFSTGDLAYLALRHETR